MQPHSSRGHSPQACLVRAAGSWHVVRIRLVQAACPAVCVSYVQNGCGPEEGPAEAPQEECRAVSPVHLPALGHPVPAAVVTSSTHGHLLAAQCPREADPEVLGITQLGLGLGDLRGSGQATGWPRPFCPPRPLPTQGVAAGGHSPAFPACLWVASPAELACPGADSPRARGPEGSLWGSRSPG